MSTQNPEIILEYQSHTNNCVELKSIDNIQMAFIEAKITSMRLKKLIHGS